MTWHLFLLQAFAADQAEIERLLNKTDDVARGESSTATISMQVKTARYERTVRMESWSQGTDKTLIRIIDPAKEKGTATLKVDDNIWNYLPKVDRTIKVPSSMMGGSWMGSHFSNDDLVKQNRLSEEFTAELVGEPDNNPDKLYIIKLTAKPDAAVVWGTVEVRLNAEEIPLEIKYFDEKGVLARTMAFSDVRVFSDQQVPSVMTVIPGDKPEEFTKIVYEALEIGADVPESTFSLQALKR